MQDIEYLYDGKGSLCGVQLSPALWHRVKSHILKTLEVQSAPEAYDAQGAWEEFKQYWDFRYPVCARVECSSCGAKCEDWEKDPQSRFKLRNANLGGLLVFHCTGCGATIRKKHFKDHMVFEMTPPGQCYVTPVLS